MMTNPYIAYEGTENWTALNQAIDELVTNSDLVEQTDRAYIVGYLCKCLSKSSATVVKHK